MIYFQSLIVSRRIHTCLVALLCILVVGYFSNLLSPLRINTDSYRFLSLAESAFHGNGYLVDGHPDQYPNGYPFLVVALLSMDLANSISFVFVNIAFLFIGVFLYTKSIQSIMSKSHHILICVMILLSWTVIKHITLPQSDLAYFAASYTSIFFILLFNQCASLTKYVWLSLSLLTGLVALQIRTVGLAIFPMIMFSILLHNDHLRRIRPLIEKKSAAILLAAGLIIGGGALLITLFQTEWYQEQILRPGSYLYNLFSILENKGLLLFLTDNFKFRIIEFGEIFINIPSNKLAWAMPMYYAAGSVAWMIVLFGAWLLAKQFTPLSVYFACYTIFMMIWPYYSPRFWLPLIPAIVVFSLAALEHICRRNGAIQLTCQTYLVYFMIAGLAALAYSTRISLSGDEFSELYGDGSLRMTYRYALANGLPVEMDGVDLGILRILEVYGATRFENTGD